MSRLRGSLEGVVSDLSGSPVAEAAVKLVPPPGREDTSAVTGGNGHFRFPDLEPGVYEVTVHAPDEGATRARTRVEAGRITRMQLTL